jgi:hypothetical protein
MSSSISSSDRVADRLPAAWARFVAAFVGAAAAAFVLLFALVLALDPYDAGRFALVVKRGVPWQGPRTANASRGRDPAYDSAVIGNSRVQLLKPETLGAGTGAAFVSLIVPGTGPREQLVILDYFRRQHRSVRMVVIGLDGDWCTTNPMQPLYNPFPFWLYSESDLTFLRGLLRYDVLERLQNRIRQLVGRQKLAPADGYWNYERDYEALGYAKVESLRQRLHKEGPTAFENHSGVFPFAGRLGAELAKLPPQTVAVMVRPPVFVTGLPKPGTLAASADVACRDAFADVAAARPRTALVDWRVDRPENRQAENWFDHTHYRVTLAQQLEADVLATIRRLSTVAAQ